MDSSSLTHKVINIYSNTHLCTSVVVMTLIDIMHSLDSIPNRNFLNNMPNLIPNLTVTLSLKLSHKPKSFKVTKCPPKSVHSQVSPQKNRSTRAETHTNTLVACLTLNAGEYNPGVIIGNDVSVAVLWFVDLQVGVLPCELLTGVDGL